MLFNEMPFQASSFVGFTELEADGSCSYVKTYPSYNTSVYSVETYTQLT